MSSEDEFIGHADYPTTLETYIGAALLEAFFYGIYFALFFTCCFLLVGNRSRKVHWQLQILGLAMFILASVDIGYSMWLVFGKLLKGDLSHNTLRVKYWFYVTNNVFADSLLLYRCYVIWNHNKRVLIGPAILLVGATASGYVLEGSSSATLADKSWAYRVAITGLNVILTSLTASRIWFISRRASKSIADPSLLHNYRVINSILIESGFVYCVYMILDVAFHTNPVASFVLGGGLIQVVGIMPTLILAQVGLGRSSRDVDTTFKATHIGTDIAGYTTVDTPTKRADTFQRWSIAKSLPASSSATQDHDRRRSVHFTYGRDQVNDFPRVWRNGSDPESTPGLADKQRFEVDDSQIQMVAPPYMENLPTTSEGVAIAKGR